LEPTGPRNIRKENQLPASNNVARAATNPATAQRKRPSLLAQAGLPDPRKVCKSRPKHNRKASGGGASCGFIPWCG